MFHVDVTPITSMEGEKRISVLTSQSYDHTELNLNIVVAIPGFIKQSKLKFSEV